MEQQSGSEIASLIREINAGINQQMRNMFKDEALTPPQMMIIFMLAQEKRLRVSDISQKMSLANSTVSGILDRMEKQGYIKRIRSSTDKRVVLVQTTEQVKAIHQQHHQAITAFFADLVEDISDQEVRSILDGLNTLKDLVRAER